MRLWAINWLGKPLALIACIITILLLGMTGEQAWAIPNQQGTVPEVTPEVTEPINITPPNVSAGTIVLVIIPGEHANISVDDGAIVVPAGAATLPGSISAKSIDVSSVPAPPGQGQVLAAMQLNFYDVSGKLVPHPHFNVPVTICFNVKATTSMAVSFYDEDQAKWVMMPTSIQDGKLCGTASHFTLFGAIEGAGLPSTLPKTGPDSIPAALPNTGNASSNSMSGWTLAIAGMMLAIGATLVLLRGWQQRTK